MHITLETDYAVRIVSCLVTNGKRMDAKTISHKTGVTLRFSLKILRKLVSAGIIRSFKGTQGGYEIAKEPSEITLREVIETIEGTYSFCRCLSDGYCCTILGEDNKSCDFRDVYEEISDMVREKLESVTFGK